MSIYKPHYEIFVKGPVLDVLAGENILAQVSPTQTREAAIEAGAELKAAYEASAGARCILHTCFHDEEGRSIDGCTTEDLWQNA